MDLFIFALSLLAKMTAIWELSTGTHCTTMALIGSRDLSRTVKLMLYKLHTLFMRQKYAKPALPFDKFSLIIQVFWDCECLFYIKEAGRRLLSRLRTTDFFEKLLMGICFTLRIFAWNLLRWKSPKKYFLYFVLMSGLGLEPWFFV